MPEEHRGYLTHITQFCTGRQTAGACENPVGPTRWTAGGFTLEIKVIGEITGEATIQTFFLLGYALYAQAHRLPKHIREAAHRLTVCRTSVLGGHVQACPDGHFKRHWYNSCKHRMSWQSKSEALVSLSLG